MCDIDPSLLPVLEELLQDIYASLQPQPVDYEHRHIMINVFNKIAGGIFGKRVLLHVREKKYLYGIMGVKDSFSCNVLLGSLLIVPDVYLHFVDICTNPNLLGTNKWITFVNGCRTHIIMQIISAYAIRHVFD